MMNIATDTHGAVCVVEVDGVIDSRASGTLSDALVSTIADGCRKLVVDVSGVGFLTRSGVRGLFVAAKLLRFTGGEMRICGATRPVEVFLLGIAPDNLLRFSPSREEALAQLSPRSHTQADRPRGRRKIKGYGWPKGRHLPADGPDPTV